MVKITKAESAYLRQNGVTGITRLMRQDSKRKHYYCCEDRYIMELLENYRKAQNVVYEYGNT